MLPVAVDLYHTCQMLLGVACGSRKTCMIEDVLPGLDLALYIDRAHHLIAAGQDLDALLDRDLFDVCDNANIIPR